MDGLAGNDWPRSWSRAARASIIQKQSWLTRGCMQALEARGFKVEVVTFGQLPFKQQIATVADAAGLVGLSGSDLVNAMFMPDGAALVEVFPLNRGAPIINPELHNFARMLGLTYVRYTSPLNATLRHDEDGNVEGDALLRQISSVCHKKTSFWPLSTQYLQHLSASRVCF